MLSRFRRLVNEETIAKTGSVITTKAPGIQNNDKGFPAGEELFSSLSLRLSGNLNISTAGQGDAPGTAVVLGPAKLLTSLTFSTDKHKNIISGIDGLSLARIQKFLTGTDPLIVLPTPLTTGTPKFEANFLIPFAFPFYLRPEDSALYMRSARAKLIHQEGVFTDVVAGGTMTTAEIENLTMFSVANGWTPAKGGVMEPGDLAIYVPFMEMRQVDITATALNKKIELPYGDRFYAGIAVSQRHLVTADENDNTCILPDANVSLEKNNSPIINKIRWADVQAATKQQFKLDSVPPGWGVINCAGENMRPVQVTEMINTVSTDQGTMNLFLDVVNDGVSKLNIISWGYMPIKNLAAANDLPKEISDKL